jgi:uncharacterized protein (TIGR02444 family)
MTGESRFWRFSLAVYANPQVQRECLALQDAHGIDVNMLLFCAFAGAVHGRTLSEEAVREAADTVSVWQKDVVATLRTARRALKPFAVPPDGPNTPAAELRARVKEDELAAERIEQAMLERWAATRIDSWPPARPADAVADNIRALLAMSEQKPEPAMWPGHLVAAALATAGP